MEPVALVRTWRVKADAIERYAPPVATALRECAHELEAALRADATDTVSPAEAAILGGYTADAIGRMIASGRIVNYGSKRRPRIRRGDVPRKPGRTGAADLTLIAMGGA